MSDTLRISDTLIDFPVPCRQCGKEYTPLDVRWEMRTFNVSLLQANNWCTRKCYNEYNESSEEIK